MPEEARNHCLRPRHPGRLGLRDGRGFIESLLVLWLRRSSWLIAREVLPDRMLFVYPPGDYTNEYPRMFPCDHYFTIHPRQHR